MYFIGLDLAWKNGKSGFAVLDQEGRLIESGLLGDDEQIASRIAAYPPEQTIIAVDAPLLVSNIQGNREAEKSLNRWYGQWKASCLPVNRSQMEKRYGGIRGEGLAQRLAPNYTYQPSNIGGSLLEVFPTASLVSLFGLEAPIPYKSGRGNTEEQIQGLSELYERLQSLQQADPPLQNLPPLERPFHQHTSRERKDWEDLLDGLVCAYIALYFYRHGRDKVRIFGTSRDGFILTIADERVRPWKLLSKRFLSHQYRLVQEKVKTPSGIVIPWVYFDSFGSVVVLPFDGAKVYLLRQYRPPLEQYVWELPGGSLEEGEPPAEAALRELAEEAGFNARSLIPLGRFCPLVGTTNLIVYAFLATDLEPVPTAHEPGEDIEVHAIDIQTFIQGLDEEAYLDGGLQFAASRARILGLL